MNIRDDESAAESVRRIPARLPARVDGLATLRTVARAMRQSGLGAVVVDTPLGPVGIVTVNDIIDAVANGADPDTVWAGDIEHPTPWIVSCEQHPAEVGAEMTASGLEMVAVIDTDNSVGMASALDILRAVLDATGQASTPRP